METKDSFGDDSNEISSPAFKKKYENENKTHIHSFVYLWFGNSELTVKTGT